jgi:hypothetical protein
MKKAFLIIALLISFLSNAQAKLITKTGKITFEASVPAFEEVKAKNENVTCILNTETGEIASLVLMKSFRFKVALMEEHFNENYIESDKYPKGTFKGKIENFDLSKLTTTAKEFTITGKLELHGKSKQISVPVKIKKTATGVEVLSNFEVNTDDFNIDIPSVVNKKVSKKVAVALNFQLN